MPEPNPSRPLLAQPARSSAQRSALLLKLLVSAVVVGGLGVLVARLDVRHDLRRLRLGVLSGSADGNYYRLVKELGDSAARERGVVHNLISQGSADNIARLAAARRGCTAAVALAQDGSSWGDSKPLLLGRLPKAESVFFLGKQADRITDFGQLAGLKIGIGPSGSGAARIAQDLFALSEFRALGAKLEHHSLAKQLELAATGQLDLALLVMDEDARLVTQAVLQQDLQLAGFVHADVIARRLPHLRTGRIGAGEYDAVALRPQVDKKVLRVETLVLGNGCATRSQTMDLLTLLSRQFPDFMRHNRDTPNRTGLELDAAAHDFFERGGPELADQYAPWAVDVMPPANWVYLVMGVSLLFNAMNLGHRFRLWRIDVARVALEGKLAKTFGTATTLGDIARTAPNAERAGQAATLISELEQLSARSRDYSLSLLVPMGAEMTYRYQEELIHQALTALREYQQRTHSSLPPPAGDTV
jgi:hypothetical protein